MRIFLITCIALSLGACESAYYSVNEKFGVLKNDILVDRVEDTMEAQEEVKQEFKDALQQFEAVVGVPESELKAVYGRLNDAYDDAQDKAATLSDRIAAVEDVSADLFEEWSAELSQISSSTLRKKSATQLKASQRRYAGLMKVMKRAESRMAPVLSSFRDYVLYLKHNLNAQAIASLQGELGGIEGDVGLLIADMERSIDEARSFIQSTQESAQESTQEAL